MRNAFLLLLTFCILFTSCFKSAKSLEGSFVGFGEKIMKNPSSKDARIMVVHGTGKKPKNYADKFVDRLVRKIARYDNASYKLVGDEREFHFNQFPGYIKIRKYEVGDRVIRFYIVNWSDVTLPLKKLLEKNESTQKLDQTILSKGLKQKVMIDELSDFVFYAGYYKDEIREPILTCMQLMYVDDDKIDEFVPLKVSNTLDLQLFNTTNHTNRDIYLLTGSIGSKVTLDIMSDYKASAVSYSCDSTICDFFYKDLRGIYMLSSQIPLLSNLYIKSSNSKGLSLEDYYNYQNYYGICRFLMKNPNANKIDFVGFNDPNDILGFKLIDAAPKCYCDDEIKPCDESLSTAAQKKINKVSCSVNNAWHFLWLANWFPAAHTKIYKNKKLVKILTRGVTPAGKLGKKRY